MPILQGVERQGKGPSNHSCEPTYGNSSSQTYSSVVLLKLGTKHLIGGKVGAEGRNIPCKSKKGASKQTSDALSPQDVTQAVYLTTKSAWMGLEST